MSPADISCTYCEDKATEWDHLRPVISNQEPTGYITEITNPIPLVASATSQRENPIGARGWKETHGFHQTAEASAIPTTELSASPHMRLGVSQRKSTSLQLSVPSCGSAIERWLKLHERVEGDEKGTKQWQNLT